MDVFKTAAAGCLEAGRETWKHVSSCHHIQLKNNVLRFIPCPEGGG